MSGGTDLGELIKSMDPVLHWDTYVFVTTNRDISHLDIRPRMQFREDEGTSLILTRKEAETHGFPYVFASRMITLNIHSSLEAVGFMAVIANELATAGIPVNPVAGYYHDHIFVPEDRAEDAMAVLLRLSGAEPPSP